MAGGLTDAEIGVAVLALDAALLGAQEELPECLRGLLDPGPTWLVDQQSAAMEHAHQFSDRAVAAGFAAATGWLPPEKQPAWLRLGGLDTLVAWALGKGSTCYHSPSPRSPQPVYGAAWKPRLVVCLKCARLLKFPRHSIPDRTCDGCGKVVAGVAAGDPIYPSAIHYGLLTYAFGVCDACRRWMDPLADAAVGPETVLS